MKCGTGVSCSQLGLLSLDSPCGGCFIGLVGVTLHMMGRDLFKTWQLGKRDFIGQHLNIGFARKNNVNLCELFCGMWDGVG